MTDQHHDDVPALANQIANDIPDIKETLMYHKDVFEQIASTWSDTTATDIDTITIGLAASNAAGPAVANEAATTTNPTLIPNKAEMDTGWGWASDTLHAVLGGVNAYALAAASMSPGVSDAAALGTTALMWGDLFLASGAVINFNNGDVTITHSANALAFAGGDYSIGATEKFYLDGGGNTYIEEVAADVMRFSTGGADIMYISNAAINSHYDNDSVEGLAINLAGYQNGATQFRNLVIADGKGANIAAFTGSTKQVDLAGVLSVDDTTDSTSGTTGSIHTDGGVGVAKTIYVGQGIQFPASQSAQADVNTLDDYEEGTWTPLVKFGGGVTGITYLINSGTYTKIGRYVLISAQVSLTSKGSDSGAVTITGSPFTEGVVAPLAIWPLAISFADQMTSFMNGGVIQIWEITNAGAVTSLDATNFANNSEFHFTCVISI